MSKINGEKARSAIARRRRTAQREKDRAALAQIKAGGAKTEEAPPKKAAAKSKSASGIRSTRDRLGWFYTSDLQLEKRRTDLLRQHGKEIQ